MFQDSGTTTQESVLCLPLLRAITVCFDTTADWAQSIRPPCRRQLSKDEIRNRHCYQLIRTLLPGGLFLGRITQSSSVKILAA